LKQPPSQSDKKRGAPVGEQAGAQSSAQPDKQKTAKSGAEADAKASAQRGKPLDERAGKVSGLYRDERGRESGNTRAGEGVRSAAGADEAGVGDGPGAGEPGPERLGGDWNARDERELRMRPIRIMGRAQAGRPMRRARAGLGWLRWGMLLPVVGFTAWAASGVLTKGWTGQWRNDESRYRIAPEGGAGAPVGHSGGGLAAKGAAGGNVAGDLKAKEPAWSDPATWTDSFGDGTPDFLRLTDEGDREAFRQWFVLIADYQALRPAGQVPKEITDCASLLRYAYREALKKHDAGWMKDTGMEVAALPGEIGAWHYPDTPLGAGLFRVTAGPFERGDESDGAFAQFADAKTLVERNAYLVSRNVWQAEPGDLLFYRQFGQSSPWHSMIVTRVGSGAAVVYDTGEDHPPHGQGPVRGDPGHGQAGELRRVELTDLLGHPEPEWRPLASNPNFLGVYRWNILRGSL